MKIRNAIYWIPNKSVIGISNITSNKIYKLIKMKCLDSNEYELFIKDDKGNYTTDYMVYKGKFVKIHKKEKNYV